MECEDKQDKALEQASEVASKAILPIQAKQFLVDLEKDLDNIADHVMLYRLKKIVRHVLIPRCRSNLVGTIDQEFMVTSEALPDIIQLAIRIITAILERMGNLGFSSVKYQSRMKKDATSVIGYLLHINLGFHKAGGKKELVGRFQSKILSAERVFKLYLSYDYPYQPEPKSSVFSDRLWSKIKNMSELQTTENAHYSFCNVCIAPKGLADYAILDACNHLYCVPCAHRLFGLPDGNKPECPMCNKRVKAFTTTEDVRRCKLQPTVKSKAVRMFKSVKKTIGKKSSSAEDIVKYIRLKNDKDEKYMDKQ
ncbi:uncharacterized protein LOC108674156 [Hyalella azteca]|uniref:Uncharacterized protein LOC108674156 n=1 Tax=Hyalella azteca TaxID=294128 RepID=A0A8B7NUW2_HYAAZ|nr:uncharacterized protein LOC108674156 [Hyalella azteca]